MFTDIIDDTKVLKIKKDDTVIVKIKYPVAAEMVEAIGRAFRDKLPPSIKDSVGIIVVDSNAEIEIKSDTAKVTDENQ